MLKNSRALKTLAEAVGVRPSQALALVAASAFQFSFIAGVAVLKASSNALLVSIGALPLLYVSSALVTGGLAAFIALARPTRRWPPSRVFVGWVLVFLLLSTLAAFEVPWAAEGLYLTVEVYATTLSVRFWATMGDIFDVRVSRRVLGVVGGVGMAGSIVGGLLTRAFGESLGPLPLIPLASVSLVACLLIAPHLKRDEPKESERKSELPAASKTSVLSDGFVRTLALLASMGAMTTLFVDFIFRSRAKETLDAGAQVALFGEVSAVVGVVAMVVQLALTGPLLRRIGLFGYLAITPVAVLTLGVTSAFVPSLWPLYVLKTVEQVGALSLNQTAMQLLYGPLHESVRASARTLVDGTAKKGAHVVGGLLLIVVASSLAPRTLTLGVALVGLVTIFVILQVRGHYVRTIGERLKTTADVENVEIDLHHALSRKLLEEAAASEDEGRVLTALELLSRDAGAKFEPLLLRLLEHRSGEVRAAAARLAGEKGAQTCAVKLTALANSDEGEVRAAAIGAVARLRPFTASRLLAPLLTHEDISVRIAAIGALMPIEPSGPAGAALEGLIARGDTASVEERVLVARLLGTIGGATSKHLRTYLKDPAPEVRRAACQAAGETGAMELVDELFVLLVARDTRIEARAALVRYGNALLPRIEQRLNERQGIFDLRYRLPRVLREIGTPEALEVILFSNIADDPFLQYRLSMAASRIRERKPDIEFNRRRAVDAAGRRIDAYEALLPVSRDLSAALGPGNLLARAVNDRLDQCLESAVWLAGLINPQRPLQHAYSRFVHGDAKTRPYAVEMIEHTIEDRELSRRLVSCFERWHRRPDWKDVGRMDRAPARLLELVASEDSLLRACALTTVRSLQKARELVQSELPAKSQGSGVHQLALVARGVAWELLLASSTAIPEEGPMSENIVERVLFLEGVDLFAECDVDDLAAVAQYVRERSYKAGEVIYRENDPGDALFVVIEGRMLLEKDGRRIYEVGERESFGETSVLDNKPRPATGRALTDMRVLVLERADFMDLIADRVELLQGVFRAITRHLRGVLDAASAGSFAPPQPTKDERARADAGEKVA